MKILISESQLRKVILSEQGSDPFVPKNILGIPQYGAYERMGDDAIDHKDEDAILRIISELVFSSLPGIGDYLNILIGGNYAREEFDKGNNKTGIVITALTAMPFLKGVTGVIPQIAELGSKGMSVIASKLVKGVKLTNTELNVLSLLEKNKPLLQKELTGLDTLLKSLGDIKSLKQNYIYKFGLQKYEELFRKLVSKEINKDQFIKELSVAKGETHKLAKWAVNAGIKFEQFEMEQMTKVIPKVQSGVNTETRILLDVDGELKSIRVIISKFAGQTFKGRALVGRDIILMNLEKLIGKTADEIGSTLSHEAAHIKDPSIVSQVYRDTYDAAIKLRDATGKKFNDLYDVATKTGKGASDAVKAGEEYTKAFTKYVFHPQEIIANNQMVLNNITKNIKKVIGNLGSKGAKQTLNNVINFVSGKSALDDAAEKLIGKEGIEHLNGLYNYSKSEYQELLKKIAKQSDYLKDQLNLLIQ